MKSLFVVFLVLMMLCLSISAQTTAFTYQGSLKDGVNPANGNYDLEFKLFDAVSGGTQQGSTFQRLNVAVANGIFTVSLDFGAVTLPGADRFLDIAVRPAGGGAFTPLTPRQQVNSAPYSVRSLNSTTADTSLNASQLGGVAANQYVVTTDPRMSDPRPPTAGSSDYIQNGTTPQTSSNFNISGTGTANIVSAGTQFNIGTNRILSIFGTLPNQGLSVGLNAGTSGSVSTFFGNRAGTSNTGGQNSFFGSGAGESNTTGTNNSFFGVAAGLNTTTLSNNSYFGTNAGNFNTGSGNSYFGSGAGSQNTNGSENAFFGLVAGSTITTGNNLSLFGARSFASGNLTNASAFGFRAMVTQDNSLVLGSINGVNGAIADTNVGIGTTAPSERLHVGGKGLFTGNLTVTGTLTATLPSGSGNYIQNGTSQQPSSNFNINGNGTASGTLQANIVRAGSQFNMGADRVLRAVCLETTYLGVGAGASNFECVGGGNQNSFLGANSGQTNTNGNHLTVVGANADVSTTNLVNATALGANAFVSQSNSLVLGSINGVNGATGDTRVGIGTSAPAREFHVLGPGSVEIGIESSDVGGIQWTLQSSSGANNGRFEIIDRTAGVNGMTILSDGSLGIGTTTPNDKLDVNGTIGVATLGAAGSTNLCRNASNQIATCSSSLRYKTNIGQFSKGLSFVNKLRPISFDWKDGGMKDVGFGAEDIANIDPRFVTYNDTGEVEGVKYDRLSVAFVNAIKEQQEQIETLQKTNAQQQGQNSELRKQVEALKTVVCSLKADADICKVR